MFPTVDPTSLFKEHPELLDWYQTNIAHSLDDIARMEMSKQKDGKTHIWVYFRSDFGKPLEEQSVGYRVFLQDSDGKYIPY